MIYVSIFGFVLASVAVILGGAALTISLTTARKQASWRATTTTHWQKLYGDSARTLRETLEKLRELERASPVKVAAEVAELSAAVAKLAETQRRFAGRYHATKGRVFEGEFTEAPNGIDPELAATIALQSAPPVRP